MNNLNAKFNDIYTQYWRLVTKVANSVVHDYSLSQDICQEVFVTFYEKAENMNEELIKYWLIVNTRRKAIDFCRKAYRRHEIVGDEDFDESDMGSRRSVKARYVEDTMADDYIEKEFIREMMNGLEEHNESWHTIVEKTFLEQRDAAEIAGELGITVENVRTKLHRAKSWMRKVYRSEFDGLP